MAENDISLPYEFESADSVPEAFRNAYEATESGGARLRLTLEGAPVKNLGGLRKAHEETAGKLTKRGAELQTLQDQLARYQDESGEMLDPDTVKQALAKIRSGKVKEEGDVAELVAKTRKEEQERAATQIKEGRGTIAELREQIAQTEIASAAARACVGTSADPQLVEMFVKNVAQLVRDDQGVMVAVIPGENGNPRLSNREGREGQNMSVEEFVKDVLPHEMPSLFPSKASGGGPSGRSSVGGGGKQFADLRGRSKLTAAYAARSKSSGR